MANNETAFGTPAMHPDPFTDSCQSTFGELNPPPRLGMSNKPAHGLSFSQAQHAATGSSGRYHQISC